MSLALAFGEAVVVVVVVQCCESSGAIPVSPFHSGIANTSYAPTHVLNLLHRKYPNPFAGHVYSVDTLSRTVDPATGIVRSERLIGVQQGAPAWIQKVRIGRAELYRSLLTLQLFQLPETAYVREVVFIDPAKTSATLMSMNLSLKDYV